MEKFNFQTLLLLCLHNLYTIKKNIISNHTDAYASLIAVYFLLEELLKRPGGEGCSEIVDSFDELLGVAEVYTDDRNDLNLEIFLGRVDLVYFNLLGFWEDGEIDLGDLGREVEEFYELELRVRSGDRSLPLFF